MVKNENWALGSNQYVKRRASHQSESRTPEPSVEPPEEQNSDRQWQLAHFAVTWRPFEVETIKPSGLERARHRFRGELPSLIWNAAALEGNNFTLPEVRTLLDGTTVGGKPIDDENQILALSDAYNRLDEMVGAGTFSLSKSVSDELHALLAVHEAIEVGHFRGEGSAQGGGNVHLASGGSISGTPHGEGGSLLVEHYEDLLEHLSEIADPRRRALVYFAAAIRRQFYFDGNKRTARMMMTGELISSGYDAISIPFARKLEFNNSLDTMFSTDDATELLQFLVSCADSGD